MCFAFGTAVNAFAGEVSSITHSHLGMLAARVLEAISVCGDKMKREDTSEVQRVDAYISSVSCEGRLTRYLW